MKNALTFVNGEPRATATGETWTIDCELAFKAVGYRGIPVDGVPFDERTGIIPNTEGRVLEKAGGAVLPKHYVVGWAKRGPTGLIGTNGPDANATIENLVADLVGKDVAAPTGGPIEALLTERQVRHTSFHDWLGLDASEVSRGKAKGKVREKFASLDEMLAEITRLRGA